MINHEVYSLNDYKQMIVLQERLKKAADKAELKYNTTRAEAEKKAKIKELKKQAIVAKAVALAKMEALPYVISTGYATKIILWLRLSDKTAMNVHIPYNDYQNVLQNTQATIQAIRKLVDEKMHISVFNSPSTANFKWQDPKI
jgi:methylase of polypeptide subunit release factors